MFAIEHARVAPDVITIAKGIASGLPLGVTTAPVDPDGGVAARVARQHVRRQPRVVRGGAGDESGCCAKPA